MGRKSKYDPKWCDVLIEAMAGGMSFEGACGKIGDRGFCDITGETKTGISKDTGYEWAKKHPEFAEAKEIGTVLSQSFWEQEAIEGRWGNKDKQFNAAVWIFTMKNRFGWRDKKEVMTTGNVADLYKDWTLQQVEDKIAEISSRLTRKQK